VKSAEVRKTFLDYFSGNNHTVVASSSLVPDKDPSLLFVNAGMVQFKNVFLGIEQRDYERATSCQKCVRAGGKHNDLENIGKTLRHHTFFEMLGNFSFGNYFKKDAIAYAWDFLGNVLNLDKERMWITVFRDDGDAAELWKRVGVREERIVPLGEKDNFWSMGDEGPCGPCSEILYDLGETVGCRTPECKVGCDCDRFLEIWNLVFMEFERTKEGEMKKLPRPSIDTGMGLERVTSVLQDKIGNYDTDLFVPILERLEDIGRCAYGENANTDIAMRVIVDHVRGATFIINDGILPSKDGRGYVLRRIIRRALRYGKKIGIEGEFLYNLSGVVADIMGDIYPEIKNNHPYIVRVLKGEEERFLETLNVGMKAYEEMAHEIKRKKSRVIPGELVYKLYDTFGFPLDLTEDMAEEDGFVIDAEGFERALEEQKTRSRTGSRLKGEGWAEGHVEVLKQGIKSDFIGYEKMVAPAATVISVVKVDRISENIGEGEEGELFFDRTPFYAESGGQIHDEGYVEGPSGKATVLEVIKLRGDLFSHRIAVTEGLISKGDVVALVVNEERRKGVSRNHTATHLLQYALRTVLGDHVKQSGSLVEEERLRFDFSHFQALEESEIARVEDIVNEKIMECYAVDVEEKDREDAIRAGATALFEEKYGDRVRVINICDFSTELCGGTHVKNTGEIGSLAITSESSLAYGVRRIEAVTGKAAQLYRRRLDATVRAVAKAVNAEVEKVPERVEGLLSELQARQKEIERLKEDVARNQIDDAITAAPEKDGVKVVSLFIGDAKAEELRRITDIIRSKVPTCVAAAASADDAKGILIVAVSKDLQGRYNAGKIIKEATQRFDGKGGGGPQIAQGGVPGERVREALGWIAQTLPD